MQFRSLDEQLFRSMATLFDQKERQGVARLVGMSAPVSIYTPEVRKTPATQERTKKYLDKCYEMLPFALPVAAAQKQLADRVDGVPEQFLKDLAGPIKTKRQIRAPKQG